MSSNDTASGNGPATPRESFNMASVFSAAADMSDRRVWGDEGEPKSSSVPVAGNG